VGDHRDSDVSMYYSQLVFTKEQGDGSDLSTLKLREINLGLIIMLRFGDCFVVALLAMTLGVLHDQSFSVFSSNL
jgi:hypothetical protein